MSTNAEYMYKQVQAKLVGGTIVTGLHDVVDGQFGFVVRKPDGTEQAVWVSCDPEWNDAGWLQFDEGK